MSRRKIFVIGAVLVAGCAGLYAFLLFSDGPNPGNPRPVEAAGISMYGYTHAGDLAWETTAQTGELTPQGGELETVGVRFYSEGLVHLEAVGDHLDQDESESRLHGNVVINRSDGLELRTDAVHWEPGASELNAGNASLAWQEVSLEAGHFSYHLGNQSASLSEGVTMTIARSTVWSIQAETAEVSETTASLAGDVTIDSADEEYRCDRLETDAEGEIVHLIGHVEARLAQGSLSAERLAVGPEGLFAEDNVSVRFSLQSLEDVR